MAKAGALVRLGRAKSKAESFTGSENRPRHVNENPRHADGDAVGRAGCLSRALAAGGSRTTIGRASAEAGDGDATAGLPKPIRERGDG
ncbi:hypothetical protein [Phreatobacter sp.]|uniref:hypothetical protein n=1 Tax=Phreatobacter sp. TaxID=1966341 RepID=UPI0025D3ED39|nr:hypothetical protein [Phreatobacter sp.]